MTEHQHQDKARLHYMAETRRRFNATPLAERERVKAQLRRANNYNDPTGLNRPTMGEIVAAYESEQRRPS